MKSTYLFRWEHWISLVALGVAVASAVFAYRAEQATISANVLSTKSDAQIEQSLECVASPCTAKRRMSWTLDIENAGRAIVQVTSVEVEVFGDRPTNTSQTFTYVTDNVEQKTPDDIVGHPEKVLGIKNPNIPARSEKRLFVFAGSNDETQHFYGARLKLQFSNGQTLFAIPRIMERRGGVTSD